MSALHKEGIQKYRYRKLYANIKDRGKNRIINNDFQF